MKTTNYVIWADTENINYHMGSYNSLEEAKAKFEKIDEKHYPLGVYIERTITETTKVLSKKP